MQLKFESLEIVVFVRKDTKKVWKCVCTTHTPRNSAWPFLTLIT